ncbi:antitoxin [Phenylobacterium aquaticum]|uniref:antitoxin n=1 Tax=Phenylobacterium aquaticum TaxID=1763816 RepID=UPI0026EEDBF2|nr:hypothetical protein [Phenylobacterium aquaticum]
MTLRRQMKLLRIGSDQAVRIPREFELPGEEAITHRYGDRLIIEPAHPMSLLALLAELPTLNEDFDPIEDPAPAPVQIQPRHQPP